MNSDVLVLFENEQVFPDALTYAREFAVRINARVTLLMLVSMSFSGANLLGARRNALRKIGSNAHRLLNDFSGPFLENGLKVTSALKIGDPAQELLKFLADRPPFQAIIWGSGQDLPFTGRGTGGHWLRRATMSLECPLLTVKKRITGN